MYILSRTFEVNIVYQRIESVSEFIFKYSLEMRESSLSKISLGFRLKVKNWIDIGRN